MKRLFVMIAVATLTALSTYAQTDSTQANAPDTIRVGGFIIVKKNKESSAKEDNNSRNFNITFRKRYKTRNSNVTTNWLILDLGFANWRDKTDYNGPAFTNQTANSGFIRNIPYGSQASNPVTENSFNLNTGKSSNVNIWFFMQKRNIVKHVLNLKYGLGLEMYNYRFETNVSFRNSPAPFVFNDSISFSKNKLYAGYLTIPFMLNINPFPNSRKGFNLSAGVSAGYLIASRNKQISDERGKQKIRGNLNMEPWRLAAVGEVGLGPVRVYGSYSLNTLMKESKTGLKQYPYVVGLRLSSF
ncbi:hypothetical protein HNQ91_004161 [Filimonas zeae]|nr:outer membrane beta-barrel protein [Filimonas zeae]MDR6341088.1 hypothetical protein [Filimonas zeae]